MSSSVIKPGDYVTHRWLSPGKVIQATRVELRPWGRVLIGHTVSRWRGPDEGTAPREYGDVADFVVVDPVWDASYRYASVPAQLTHRGPSSSDIPTQ